MLGLRRTDGVLSYEGLPVRIISREALFFDDLSHREELIFLKGHGGLALHEFNASSLEEWFFCSDRLLRIGL